MLVQTWVLFRVRSAPSYLVNSRILGDNGVMCVTLNKKTAVICTRKSLFRVGFCSELDQPLHLCQKRKCPNIIKGNWVVNFFNFGSAIIRQYNCVPYHVKRKVAGISKINLGCEILQFRKSKSNLRFKKKPGLKTI